MQSAVFPMRQIKADYQDFVLIFSHTAPYTYCICIYVDFWVFFPSWEQTAASTSSSLTSWTPSASREARAPAARACTTRWSTSCCPRSMAWSNSTTSWSSVSIPYCATGRRQQWNLVNLIILIAALLLFFFFLARGSFKSRIPHPSVLLH